MSNTNVSIIGFGWVGKYMKQLFPDAVIHDPHLNMYAEEAVNISDVCFVCVPTPCPAEGALDISIVEEIVSWCKADLIVIRSTINPGTADMLMKKYGVHIVVQPEYLGETPAHPFLDPKTRQFMILGGDKKDVRKLINLYTTVYNANVGIRQVTAVEAEVIKMSENRAIAFKVAECQELYDVCEKAGVDYYTIREAVYSDDPRFNLWWSFVYPEKRGFQSKCIPKDIYAWKAWAESVGVDPVITKAILEKNKEWISTNL